jgi:hypothetical protein
MTETMTGIEFDVLYEYISESIKREPTIIYIGVGTKFYPPKDLEDDLPDWGLKNNQQFPPFLQDIKQKYMDVKIILILIDPAFVNGEEPYVVKTTDSFLHNSWSISSDPNNLAPNHFISGFGIEVIVLDKCISWGICPTKSNSMSETKFDSKFDTKFDSESCEYDIEPFLTELARIISLPQHNSLLFYHEFTGSNPILLENSIKKSLSEQYNEDKICIDISRGSDLSCYFNLTDPTNYPVITIKDNVLKYSNPELLDDIEKKKILQQFKKFTNGFFTDRFFTDGFFNNEPALKSSNYNIYGDTDFSQMFSKFETNYLIDKPDEMLLCFQIIKSDLLTIKLISDGIISMIRQFYTMNNKEHFGTKMYGVPYIKTISSKYDFINAIPIIENLEFIDVINKNKHIIPDYEKVFDEKKNKVLEQLYQLVQLTYIAILTKYDVEIDIIENLIVEFKNLPNKYNLIEFNKSFINLLIW